MRSTLACVIAKRQPCETWAGLADDGIRSACLRLRYHAGAGKQFTELFASPPVRIPSFQFAQAKSNRTRRLLFAWRKRWDSNPCDLAVNRISSAARYDHFDTFPYIKYLMLLHYNTLFTILQHIPKQIISK